MDFRHIAMAEQMAPKFLFPFSPLRVPQGELVDLVLNTKELDGEGKRVHHEDVVFFRMRHASVVGKSSVHKTLKRVARALLRDLGIFCQIHSIDPESLLLEFKRVDRGDYAPTVRLKIVAVVTRGPITVRVPADLGATWWGEAKRNNMAWLTLKTSREDERRRGRGRETKAN